MKILIVNDDGIKARGIEKLAEYALAFGDVWVVAPEEQCSAMSHMISIHKILHARKYDFPVKGVKAAYAVNGTPADCVKVGIEHVVPGKPDLVLSGINRGYNVGVDILYSGTVGAAMDALTYKVPAIAVSSMKDTDYADMEVFFQEVMQELLETEIGPGEIWNVNFPGCAPEDVKGILRDRKPADTEYYFDHYDLIAQSDEILVLSPVDYRRTEVEEDTDIYAVLHDYISIGKLKNEVL